MKGACAASVTRSKPSSGPVSGHGDRRPAGPAGAAQRRGRQEAGSVANEAGLVALGEEMHRSQKGRRAGRRPRKVRSRRRRIVRRVGLISLAVVLVVLGGGAGYAYYLTHDLHRVNVQGLNSALTTGQEAGTENILMVGSTSRCALTVQNAAYGLCSQGVNGVNSDVIMILHADPAHHRWHCSRFPVTCSSPTPAAPGRTRSTPGCTRACRSWWRRSRRTSGSRSSTRCPSTSISSPTLSTPSAASTCRSPSRCSTPNRG